jgi:hypothetical protein
MCVKCLLFQCPPHPTKNEQLLGVRQKRGTKRFNSSVRDVCRSNYIKSGTHQATHFLAFAAPAEIHVGFQMPRYYCGKFC